MAGAFNVELLNDAPSKTLSYDESWRHLTYSVQYVAASVQMGLEGRAIYPAATPGIFFMALTIPGIH